MSLCMRCDRTAKLHTILTCSVAFVRCKTLPNRDCQSESLAFPHFFFTIQRMLDLDMPDLKLHPDSFVFLGGGWKGHTDKQIDKLEFYELIEKKLGIPNARLRDGYGSVEHSIPYIECANHHFHVPIYSKVIIRDLRSLQPMSYGKE